MSEKRFEIIENEGLAKAVYIIVDKQTLSLIHISEPTRPY